MSVGYRAVSDHLLGYIRCTYMYPAVSTYMYKHLEKQ